MGHARPWRTSVQTGERTPGLELIPTGETLCLLDMCITVQCRFPQGIKLDVPQPRYRLVTVCGVYKYYPPSGKFGLQFP